MGMGSGSINGSDAFEIVVMATFGKGNGRSGRAPDQMHMAIIERGFSLILMDMLHSARSGGGCARVLMSMPDIEGGHTGERMNVNGSSIPICNIQFVGMTPVRIIRMNNEAGDGYIHRAHILSERSLRLSASPGKPVRAATDSLYKSMSRINGWTVQMPICREGLQGIVKEAPDP